MLTKKHYAVLAFSALYLLIGGWYFWRDLNSEFVIYIGVIAVLLGGVFATLSYTRFPVWMLSAFSFWGLLHVLGGAVVIGDHVLFAHRIYPFLDMGGDFYILKYDQVVHFYLYGLVAVMTFHLLRQHLAKTGHRRLLALVAILTAVGVSALNEIMEFLISLKMENGVGGYDNTMLDIIANLLGAIVAVVIYLAVVDRKFETRN